MRKTVGHIINDAMRLLQQPINGSYAENQGRQFYIQVEQDIYNIMVNRGAKDLYSQVDLTWTANSATLVLPKKWKYVTMVGQETGPNYPRSMPITTLANLLAGRVFTVSNVDNLLQKVAPEAEVPVTTQPATGVGLYVKSSSASDTTQTITLESRDANGNRQIEQKTITGTTSVAFSGYTHKEIVSISKVKTTVGDITLYDSDDSAIALIGFWEESPSYSKLRIGNAPTAATTFSCVCVRRYEAPLSNASMPFMAGLDNALINGIVEWARRETREEQSAVIWHEWLEQQLGSFMAGMAANGGAVEGPVIVARC